MIVEPLRYKPPPLVVEIEPPLPEIEEFVIVTVLLWTQRPPPEPAEFPLMVHEDMATVPPRT